jgi:hypothetical protein
MKIKKIISVIVTISMLLSLCAINIFAEDTSGAVIWQLKNTESKAEVQYSTDAAYEGNRSIHIKYNGSFKQISGNCSEFGLQSGKAYDISFYFKDNLVCVYMAQPGMCIANKAPYIVSPSYPDVGQTVTGPDENGWYKFEVRNYTGVNPSYGLINIENWNNSNDFYLDNLSIKETESGKEMIEDGGFETDKTVVPSDPDDDDPPAEAPYITEFGETNSMLSYSDKIAYEGTRSLRVTPEDKGAFCRANDIGMKQNKEYDISFYFYANPKENMGVLRVNLGNTWNNNGGNVASIQNCEDMWPSYNYTYYEIKPVDGKANWYSFKTKRPWSMTYENPDIFNIQEKGTRFYIDNLSIKEHETQTELVPNGGFEKTGEEPTVPDEISAPIVQFGETSPTDGVTYSTGEAHSGARSLHFKGDFGNGTNLFSTGNIDGLKAGKKYNISFYYKGDVEVYIRLGYAYTKNEAWFDNTNSVSDQYGGTISKITAADNGWYKFETTVPWEYKEEIGLITPTGNRNFYIDDFSITDEAGNEIIENGGFEPDPVEASAYKVTKNDDGTVTVSVTVNNYSGGNDVTAQLIIASYKGARMTAHAKSEVTAIEEGGKVTLTQTLQANEGEQLTAFLWDSLENMVPIAPSQIIVE